MGLACSRTGVLPYKLAPELFEGATPAADSASSGQLVLPSLLSSGSNPYPLPCWGEGPSVQV